MYFPNYRLQKTLLDNCIKNAISEDPSRSNVVNGPKHCWNLNNSALTIFSDKFEDNWVGKSLS